MTPLRLVICWCSNCQNLLEALLELLASLSKCLEASQLKQISLFEDQNVVSENRKSVFIHIVEIADSVAIPAVMVGINLFG